MDFYRNLYVSEYVEPKKDKIINKLKAGKLPFDYYLLVLLKEGENQLEFYSTTLLYQKKLKEESIFVVGIASSYQDAVYLVEDIVKEVYEATGTVDIRTYILNNENQKA